MKFLSFFFVVLLSTACIKTAEQVNREKRFDHMNSQLADNQGLVADLVSQMKDMQTQLDRLTGRLDEIEHRNRKLDPEAITKLGESVSLIKTQQETEGSQLVAIQNDLKDQKAFLEKVMSSLSAQKEQPKAQKKSAKSDLDTALDLVKTNKYEEARVELESLIDHNELTPGDKNRVFFALGKTEYYTKNYDKALTYFSKLYSKYPKATMAPGSLLFIARSLKKVDKKDEAKEAFEKVLSDYPNSPEAKEAKKEM